MPMPVVIKIANAANTYDTSVVIYHYAATQLGYADAVNGLGPPSSDFVTYNFSFVPAIITVDPDNKTMASGSLTQVFTPLAVSILNFAANKTATGNKINLALSYSKPVDRVILLKSANGNDFTDAGEMQLINASGTINYYSFNDALPFMPASFYRAKIYSATETEYSAIVKVQQTHKKNLTVSPNPAADVVNISFNNPGREKVAVRVVNAAGKVMMETETKNDFIHFDVSNLSAGMYVAQVLRPGRATEADKFLVNH